MDAGFSFLFAGLIPLAMLVLVIVYVAKTNSLKRRMDVFDSIMFRLRSLEDEVTELKKRVAERREPVIPPSQTLSDVGIPLSPAPRTEPHAPTPPVHSIESVPTLAGAFQSSGSVPLRPPVAPSRTREEWEALIGGKLLNRIGALALIIGIGFFLKYAFDNNWITETMRVAIGFASGAGLLIIAAFARKKEFEVFAQGLVGAGLAVLYLSVYASFSFYHLVPQIVAFMMMSAVTILAFLQAFKYDSFAVSVLALVGGFLTPFLLSTGEANEVGLFTYIALLDAGIVAVLLMKDRWALLEPLAFGATYLIYLLWYKAEYVPGDLLTTTYFLIVFWVLFYGLDVYRGLKSVVTFLEMRVGVATANALFFYIALYSLIEPEHHSAMGAVTLVMGIMYFGVALVVRKRNPEAAQLFVRQILAAIISLVVATAIEFGGFKTITYWSVEALVLVLCGLRWRQEFVWISGIAVYGCALLKLLYNPESFSTFPVVDAGLILNHRAFAFAVLAVSMGMTTDWLRKGGDAHSLRVARILDYVWPVLIVVLITVETTGHFKTLKIAAGEYSIASIEFKELLTLAVLWMMYSLTLFWFGMRKQVHQWMHVAMVASMLSVCMCVVRGLSYSPIGEFQLILNVRVLAILAVAAGTFVLARWIRLETPFGVRNAAILGVMGVIVVVLLLDLVTGETKDYFEKLLLGVDSTSVDYARLSNLQQLSLSGVWLLYSILLMGVGIWRRHRGIRITSMALFGFTILKIFIYDLSFLDTLYRIFSFIGLGVILLVVSYLYQRYKEVILGDAGPA